MNRRIQDAVTPGHQTNVQPATIIANSRLSNREALCVLDNLTPTSGNLAASEAWRRIVGGRNRFNRNRQNVAKLRRKAILGWLMRNRMYWRCEQLDEWVLVDRIIVRHGDGAMIAKALSVGKATICRDLSTLQAVHPTLFGSKHSSIPYDEYMNFWRYSHRTDAGNEQPAHNLRFAANQRGPKARSLKRAGVLDRRSSACTENMRSCSNKSLSTTRHGEPMSTGVEDYLQQLASKCPTEDVPPLTPPHHAFILSVISG